METHSTETLSAWDSWGILGVWYWQPRSLLTALIFVWRPHHIVSFHMFPRSSVSRYFQQTCDLKVCQFLDVSNTIVSFRSLKPKNSCHLQPLRRHGGWRRLVPLDHCSSGGLGGSHKKGVKRGPKWKAQLAHMFWFGCLARTAARKVQRCHSVFFGCW